MTACMIGEKELFSTRIKFYYAAFSFGEKGAKEKAWQKEKRRKKVSPSAEGEEGFAPSTAQAFEKA